MGFVEFIGYAVCYAGGVMIVCSMLTGCCMLGNMAVRGLIGWYGGWQTFLRYHNWLAEEKHKNFVEKMASRVTKQEIDA